MNVPLGYLFCVWTFQFFCRCTLELMRMYVFNRYRFKVFDKTASLIELGLSLPPRFILFFLNCGMFIFLNLIHLRFTNVIHDIVNGRAVMNSNLELLVHIL